MYLESNFIELNIPKLCVTFLFAVQSKTVLQIVINIFSSLNNLENNLGHTETQQALAIEVLLNVTSL